MQPLEQGDFPVPCLVPCTLHKAAASTNSRTWWRHSKFKRGLPSSCFKITHAPGSRPVFELVVLKHMAWTKFSSPHSWMVLCAAWAIAWHAVRSLECPTTSSLPLLRPELAVYPPCLYPSSLHQFAIPVYSQCSGWLEGFKNHTQLKLKIAALPLVYGKLWGCWATLEY